jgi:type IV pilus assembly protein PilO
MKLDLDALQNVPKSQKILMTVLFFVVIVGGFAYWIFLPQLTERGDLKQQVADLNAQISLNQTKSRKLEILKNENAELQKMLEELRAQLPAEQEVSDLLKQVSDRGVQSGLDFKLWKPGSRRADDSGLYVEIPVDVEVAGGYHSVAVFLDRVSKLPRIVNVSNIKMQNGKTMGDRVTIQTSFVATTFAAVEE